MRTTGLKYSEEFGYRLLGDGNLQKDFVNEEWPNRHRKSNPYICNKNGAL